MVSMKDIAKRCNVSIATVSKALSDQSDVSIAKKKEIVETAKEMGYMANSFARILKTKRSYNLGVLFVDDGKYGLTHEFFAGILNNFKVEAEESGYDITFINCNKVSQNKFSYLEHSRYRGFDGVIIACIDFSNPEVLEIINSDLPLVTIDCLFSERLAVISNNVKGMKDLVQYAYDMGHTKIAYIHGEDSATTRFRLTSFYKTLEELGVEIPNEYVLKGVYRDSEISATLTNQLLDMENPPTCILYSDDYTAVSGLREIKNRGLKISEDISIAGYDGINVNKDIYPNITTIVQDTQKIGKIAAQKLINLIENPRTTLIEHITVDGYLSEGTTIKKRTKVEEL